MSKSPNFAPAAHPPARRVARRPASGKQARSYDQRTGAFHSYRRALVEALPVSQGQVVLDVGSGTGLCSGLLQDKVGPQGGVVGIEESPEMAAVARERIADEGWRNVTVVQSPAEDALRNVMAKLRPGAWVAAGGGKWAAPWLVGVNLQARMLHAPFVRSFEGFGRPWSHLEQLIEDVHVRELALGGGYIVTGQAPQTPS